MTPEQAQQILENIAIYEAGMKLYNGEALTPQEQRAIFPTVRKLYGLSKFNEQEEEIEQTNQTRLEAAIFVGHGVILDKPLTEEQRMQRLEERKEQLEGNKQATPEDIKRELDRLDIILNEQQYWYTDKEIRQDLIILNEQWGDFQEMVLRQTIVGPLNNINLLTQDILKGPADEDTPYVKETQRIAQNTMVEMNRDLLSFDLRNLEASSSNVAGSKTDTVANYIDGYQTDITNWESNLEPENKRVNLKNAKLHGINLNGLNLSNTDFAGSDLEGTSFKGANVAEVDFTGTNVSVEQLLEAHNVSAIKAPKELRESVLATQKIHLQAALNMQHQSFEQITPHMHNEQFEALHIQLSDNFERLGSALENAKPQDLDNLRAAVILNHKGLAGANALLGDNGLQALYGLEEASYLAPEVSKTITMDEALTFAMAATPNTLEVYRSAVILDERESARKALETALDAGIVLAPEYRNMEPYIRNNTEETKKKPGSTQEVIDYAKSVQSGTVKTPDTNDNMGLNLMNKLTVNALYPKSSSDSIREHDQVAQKFLQKRVGLCTEMQTSTLQHYITDNHPTLRSLLTTSPDEIARTDYPWIKSKGSAFAARDLRFFQRWEEGLTLITEAQTAVEDALRKSGGEITPSVAKTLAQYDEKALAYLKEQIEMAPDHVKQEHTEKGKTTVVQKEKTFGKGDDAKSKADAIEYLDGKIQSAKAVAASPDEKFTKAGAVDEAKMKSAVETVKAHKEASKPTAEPKQNILKRGWSSFKKGCRNLGEKIRILSPKEIEISEPIQSKTVVSITPSDGIVPVPEAVISGSKVRFSEVVAEIPVPKKPEGVSPEPVVHTPPVGVPERRQTRNAELRKLADTMPEEGKSALRKVTSTELSVSDFGNEKKGTAVESQKLPGKDTSHDLGV